MLADCSIAIAVKEADGNRLTETGLSLGSPQSMSSEIRTMRPTVSETVFGWQDVRTDAFVYRVVKP